MQEVWREREGQEPQRLAEGYERTHMPTAQVGERPVTWNERLLLVRSLQHAGAATAALQARVTKAPQALAQLTERKQGKKRFDDVAAVQQAAQAILKAYRVEGLLTLTVTEQGEERPVRAYGI